MNKRKYLTDYCGRTHCGHCSLSFDFACPLLLFSNWDVTPDDAVDKTISQLQEAGEIPSNLDIVTVKTPTAPTAVTVKLTELTDECIERIAEAVAKKLKAKPREKFLPCECGHNRRETWFDVSTKETILICEKCRTAVRGKTDEEARRRWNEVMKSAVN